MTAILLGATPASGMSLEEAVRAAVNGHPSVGARAAAKRAKEAQLEQANSALYPTLRVDADAGAEYDDEADVSTVDDDGEFMFRRQVGLTASYVVFDGYERANRIYYRAARVDAESRRVLAEAQTVAVDAIEAYIDHRRHWFLVGIADDNIARHQRILSLARTRLAGGAGTEGEIELIRERLHMAEAARADVYRAALEADAKFEAVVGVKPRNTHRVAYPTNLPGSMEQALAMAAANNPRIAAANAEIDALGYEVARNEGMNKPEISLEGSATVGQDIEGVEGHDTNVQAIVRLRWTLFDGGLRHYQREEAIELRTERQLDRDASLRDIQARIGRAFATLRAGAERYAALERRSEAARALEEQYGTEFEAGRKSLIDVLNASASVFNARFESVSASSARIFAAYRLKALTGTLLPSLGIAPPPGASEQYRTLIPEEAPVFNISIEPLRTD